MAGGRGRKPTGLLQNVAQIVVDLGNFRLQCERATQRRFRLDELPRLCKGGAQFVLKLRDVGTRSCRGPIVAERSQIGRASCRARVCQYVEISVVAVAVKTKKTHKKNTNT